MIRAILADYLRSPSSYGGNVWGYARNQAWHAWGIGGLGTLALQPWLGPWAAAVLIAGYALAIELPQILRDDAELWDSVEDAAHVAGAALAVAGAWEAGLVQLAFYASGILRRRAERDAG
jgi:hypothetical protein